MKVLSDTEAEMSKSRAYVRTKYSFRKAKKFAKKHPVAAAIFALAVIAILVYGAVQDANAPHPEPREGFYVHYIDVGQGDCELIECDGEYMLIDAGWPENGGEVVDYILDLGVDRLEYLVCSHGDADHCGGFSEVLKYIDVDTVFVNPYGSDSVFYSIFLNKLDDEGLEPTVPEAGESYSLGTATVRFLGPAEDFGDSNENSLIVRVEYGETAFLFTGDVQQLGEASLLESGADLKCDVLKVAHHGSYTSTSYRFLYEADPDMAVISCGKDNEYGHPHDVVLDRLSDAGVKVFRTDTDGTVVISSDGVKVERTAA